MNVYFVWLPGYEALNEALEQRQAHVDVNDAIMECRKLKAQIGVDPRIITIEVNV